MRVAGFERRLPGHDGRMTMPPSPLPSGPPYAPAPSPDKRLGVALLGLVAGLVLAGLVVGVLFATDTLNVSGPSGRGVSGSADVTMPDELGGYKTEIAVVRGKGNVTAATSAEKRLDHTRELTAKQYAEAYPGAGVGVQTYADGDLHFFPTVIAVRADSAPILASAVVADPADLGLAVNQQEIKEVGDVRCIVYHLEATTAGETPDPQKIATSLCQRTGDRFTVFVAGDAEGGAGLTKMADLTKAAYDRLRG